MMAKRPSRGREVDVADEITSVGELAKAVRVLSQTNTLSATASTALRDRTIWFRGQLEGLPLLPTIYRKGGNSKFERELIRDLKLTAVRLLDKPPKNEWEWLFIARHHGFVSRLLDWSESPLIALYFALREKNQPPVDCILWALDPYQLNQIALNEGKETPTMTRVVSVPVAGHPLTKKYLLPAAEEDEDLHRKADAWLPKYPIAIRAPQLTPRSVAQRGVFTIHGHEKIALESLDGTIGSKGAPALQKLVVPSAARRNFLRDLHALGITESVLFPDLEGLIRNLHRIYSPYNKDSEKIRP
jgi:hypothetical protein